MVGAQNYMRLEIELNLDGLCSTVAIKPVNLIAHPLDFSGPSWEHIYQNFSFRV